jgi:hypothetical protein
MNIKNSTLSFGKPASLIMCHAHMLINKMGRQRESIDTLLKSVYLSLLMRVMLQAHGLWNMVTEGALDYTEDRMALEVIA